MSIGADKIAVTCWQVACHGKKFNNISKCSNQNSANFVCNSASLALVYENWIVAERCLSGANLSPWHPHILPLFCRRRLWLLFGSVVLQEEHIVRNSNSRKDKVVTIYKTRVSMFLSVGVWHCVTVTVRDSLLQKRPPILSLSRARARVRSLSLSKAPFSLPFLYIYYPFIAHLVEHCLSLTSRLFFFCGSLLQSWSCLLVVLHFYFE